MSLHCDRRRMLTRPRVCPHLVVGLSVAAPYAPLWWWIRESVNLWGFFLPFYLFILRVYGAAYNPCGWNVHDNWFLHSFIHSAKKGFAFGTLCIHSSIDVQSLCLSMIVDISLQRSTTLSCPSILPSTTSFQLETSSEPFRTFGIVAVMQMESRFTHCVHQTNLKLSQIQCIVSSLSAASHAVA